MRTRTFLTALVVAAPLSALFGQTPPATPAPTASVEQTPAPAPNPKPGEPGQPSVLITDEQPTGSVSKSKDTLSVDFPDEEIRTILRNVADLFELNLVVPDTLQGKSTIKLRDVTWRQIFQVVLSPVGYTFVEDGSIIKIVSQESLALEPVATDVFILNYARADEIKKSVEPLVDAAAGGKVIVDTRSNAMVISERPSRMSRIRSIIEQLDKATDQVMIESKFIEVTNNDVKNIGVNWSSLSGYSVGAGDLTQTFTRDRGQSLENTGSLSNSNSTGSTNSTSTTTTGVQSNGATTTSTVTSTNGTPVSTSSTGSNASLTNSTNTTGANGTTGGLSEALSNLQSLTSTAATGRATSAVFSADQFNVILSALKTTGDTKLVSNPTVVTLNNTESQINIGEEYPIPSYTYNQERGTYEVSGFTYRPIGIILKVTPQVNARGFIKLTIEPEVSSRSGAATFGTASIPIISTRKTRTQVSLKDGFTMGIGGLIENNLIRSQTKVPVLGSIPGLGRLFRSDSTDDKTRNLLIFITAKTVNAEGASIQEVFDSRAVRATGLRKDELPGYRDGTDPFAPAPETEKKGKKK